VDLDRAHELRAFRHGLGRAADADGDDERTGARREERRSLVQLFDHRAGPSGAFREQHQGATGLEHGLGAGHGFAVGAGAVDGKGADRVQEPSEAF